MTANNDRLRILFLDDVPTDIELAERAIRLGGVDFVSRRASCREELERELEAFSPNIVVTDYSMPAFDGMTALGIARAWDGLMPVIILTGSMNEATAVECIKAGASDYVIKEHISRLPYAVLEAVDRHRLKTIAREQEEAIRQSELRYRALFEDCHAVMLVIDPESGAIVEANQAAAAFYGWSREELLGMSIFRINTRDEASLRRDIAQALSSKNGHFEFKHRTSGGAIRDVETHSGAISLN
ncbi:MAG: PAS domain S-box protein, partial [Spirochaetaceae bacterium]|nr:PAS domain S-box protein [Spirochaetaceae bacterium]